VVQSDVLRRIPFHCDEDYGPQLVWREGGTRYAQQYVNESDRYGLSVLVWTGIMYKGRTPLHTFERGSVTSQRYCAEIILNYIHLFRVR